MTAEAHEDFIDVIACLEAEGCDFVVVGAHALAIHGSPRATGDLDVFVRPDPDNSQRVFRALQRFGAPLSAHGVSPRDFSIPGTIYQMGLPPRRIDVLTELSGITYDDAVDDPVFGHLGGQSVRCIGLEAMLRNKRASGRAKDLADAEVLEELLRNRK